MKTSNQTMELLLQTIAADTTIKGEEMRVYLAWVTDKDTFSACPTVILQRLPHMEISQVRRAFRGLEKRGYVIADGYGYSNGKRFKKYALNVAPTPPEPTPKKAGMPSTEEASSPSSDDSKEASAQPIPSKRYLLTNLSNESEVREDKIFKEYEDIQSCRYQWLFKNPMYKELFDSFPVATKDRLWSEVIKYEAQDPSEAKDRFITALEKHRQKSLPKVDIDSLEIDL